MNNQRIIPNVAMFLLAAICVFSFAGQTEAAPINITLVTDYSGNSDPLIPFLNANFTNIASITTGNYNSNPNVGAADLVIVSRKTNSGNYDDNAAEVDYWNGLSQPLLLLSGYLPRNSRWDWTNQGSQGNVSSAGDESYVTAAGLADPLLNGVTITGGQADLFNVGGSGGNIGQWTNLGGVGGGDILVQDASGTHIGLASWVAGDALESNGPGTLTAHGGPRIYFGMHDGNDPSHLTADGQQVLINALTQFGLELPAIPEPSTFALAAFSLVGVVFHLRRRKK